MNREEAIKILKEHHDHWMRLLKEGICTEEEGENTIEALEMALKALERERKKYTRPRHCDCCGVLLTEDNNKCGYELCDECNERLEQSMERGRNEQRRSDKALGNIFNNQRIGADYTGTT